MSIVLVIAGLLVCAQPRETSETKKEKLSPSMAWLRSVEETYSVERIKPATVRDHPVVCSSSYALYSPLHEYWALISPEQFVIASGGGDYEFRACGHFSILNVKSPDIAEGDVFVYAIPLLGSDGWEKTGFKSIVPDTTIVPGVVRVGTIKVRRLESGKVRILLDISNDALTKAKSLDDKARRILNEQLAVLESDAKSWQADDSQSQP